MHKKYVLSNETFEFGPLLCGKCKLLWASYCLFFRTRICIQEALAPFKAVLNARVSFKFGYLVGGGGGGGGDQVVYHIKFCATPKSRVKQPFLPENGCTFCPL